MTGFRRASLLPLAVFVLVLAVGAAGWLYFGHGAGQGGGVGGPFTLTDGSGRTVTDRDLRGRYLLVYFGYTFCPDVCPTTLATIAGALGKMGKRADEVQPVFITVDPERDTPKVIGAYTAAFSRRILGLTGTPEQIAGVARAYRVYYAKQKTGEGAGDYTMNHSSIVYLMDKQGRFDALLPADETAQKMADDITRHMDGG